MDYSISWNVRMEFLITLTAKKNMEMDIYVCILMQLKLRQVVLIFYRHQHQGELQVFHYFHRRGKVGEKEINQKKKRTVLKILLNRITAVVIVRLKIWQKSIRIYL